MWMGAAEGVALMAVAMAKTLSFPWSIALADAERDRHHRGRGVGDFAGPGDCSSDPLLGSPRRVVIRPRSFRLALVGLVVLGACTVRAVSLLPGPSGETRWTLSATPSSSPTPS